MDNCNNNNISSINPNDISLCSFIDELTPNLSNINIKDYSIKHTKILDSFSIALLNQIKYKLDHENEINTDSKEMIAFKTKLKLIINDIQANKSTTKSQLYQFYQNLKNINYYILIYKTFFVINVKSNIITTHIVFKFTLQISRRSGVVLIENLSVMIYYQIYKILNKESINLNDILPKSQLFKIILYNSVIDELSNTKCGCLNQNCFICKEKVIRPFDEFVEQLNKIANYNDSIKEESILFFSNKLYSTLNAQCSFCPDLNNFPIFPEAPVEKVSRLFYSNDSDHHCMFYACEKCYDMMNANNNIQLCPNCFKFCVNFHYLQRYKNNQKTFH